MHTKLDNKHKTKH